jgi:hypothetical protein
MGTQSFTITSELPTIRQEYGNPFGQHMLRGAEYAFFIRLILFFRLGGWSNATRRAASEVIRGCPAIRYLKVPSTAGAFNILGCLSEM